MNFDEGFAIFLSTIIGAGVFALPVIAGNISPLYTFILLSIAFLFSAFLGYTILNLAPADVEEEVNRLLGKGWATALHIINIAIILLSLTAYAIALEYHLKTNIFILLLLLFIPLFFHITFPAAFSITLSLFILIFLAFISLVNISTVSRVPVPQSHAFSAAFLFAAYFAFFGHNVIGRIRNIVRNMKEVREIVLLAPVIVFLVYLPFTLTTPYLGTGETASLILAKFYSEPLSSIISVSAAIIFYTSFILLGIHLKEMLPRTKFPSLIIVLLVAFLYYLSKIFSVSFSALIASAGLFVTLWALIVSLAAYRSSRKKPFIQQVAPVITAVLSLLPYLFLVAGF